MTDLALLVPLAQRVVERCTGVGLKVATAESCTGGLVAGALTEIAGSSLVVERGFITYSNEAKSEQLGVPPDLIASVGAVSDEVAAAMAEGALQNSRADLVVAVTGIAGPGGGSAEKPVGLVHFAAARKGGPMHLVRKIFSERDRSGVRLAAAEQALHLLDDLI